MLTRWDPLREMTSLRSAMDRLLDRAFIGEPEWESPRLMSFALDVSESDNEYQVEASLPGIDPEDLEITYTGNTLTIKGETKSESEKEGARYHMRERRFGSFSRSITLPSTVDASKIEANYEKGVLKLQIPKAEEAKPKRIEVKTPKMIEGKIKGK